MNGEPYQILNLLMDAMRNHDTASFVQLCRTQQEAIRERFSDWMVVPESIRGDKAATDLYANTMIATAQFFAQELKTPDLLERLMGRDDGDDPFKQWMEGLRQAKSLTKQLQYDEAIQRLTELIGQGEKMYGPAIDEYLPVAYGELAWCYFHSGQIDKAFEPAGTALRLCEEQGDIDGIHAYLSGLYDMERYRGNKDRAADYAVRLSKVLATKGDHEEAARFAKQADIVRAGEPLNRVVIDIGGKQYELDDPIPMKEGRVQINYMRNRISLDPAQALCALGEKLGGDQKFNEALEAFQRAASIDPYDPHPRFLEGLTLLNLGRYADAVEAYEAVERLAPGWFNCRTDLWVARELVEGRMTHDQFLDIIQLEDSPLAPEQKAQIAKKLIDERPDAALLYLHYGNSLAAMHRTREAEMAYRRGLECAPEPAMESKLLIRLGNMGGSPQERRQMLERVIQLNGDLYSMAVATIGLAGLSG